MSAKQCLPYWSVNVHPEEFIELQDHDGHWVTPLSAALAAANYNTQFRVNELAARTTLETVVDLGARYVRTDFAWNFVHFEIKAGEAVWGSTMVGFDPPPVYNASALNAFQHYIELLQEYRLELICILDRKPAWVTAAEAKDPECLFRFFGFYCYKMAQTFGPHVACFQIWNEPNNFIQDKASASKINHYARLMLTGNQAICKAGHANACSMNVMCNNDTDWQRHLDGYFMYMNGADPRHTIRIIGIDHYPGTWSWVGSDPWKDWAPLDAVFKSVTGIGVGDGPVGRNLMIMETGYASDSSIMALGGRHSQDGQEHWINDSLPVAYARTLEYNRRQPGLIQLFNWYELNDSNLEWNALEVAAFNFEHHFGIVDKEGRRKQGYDSLKRIIGCNTRNLAAAHGGAGAGRDLFYRTADGLPAHCAIAGTGEVSPVRVFTEAGAGRGDLACAYSVQRGRSEVFVVGGDRHLHFYYWENGQWHWGGEWFYDAKVYGTVAAVYHPGQHHSNAFFKDDKGRLNYAYIRNGQWARDQKSFDAGGKVQGAIAAFYNENSEHPEVFFAGADGLLRYYYVDGTWQGGDRSPGPVRGDIAAVYNPKTAHAEVLFTGAQGCLEHFSVKGGNWVADHAGTISLKGVRPLGAIAATYNPSTQGLDAFVRGADGHLWHLAWDGAAWQVEHAAFAAAPVIEGGIAAFWIAETRTLEAIYRGRDHSAVRFFRTGSGWDSHVIPLD